MNEDEESFLIYSRDFLSKIKIEEYQVSQIAQGADINDLVTTQP